MWIVRFALQKPYTFVIVAVLIAIFGFAAIATTPTDILPEINIPIVSVIWSYSGMDSDDMSKRIVGVCERALPTTVNGIQYTESRSYDGVGVIKIHFQPNVQIDLAIAQVTALAQSLLRLMPAGILPPYVLKYDASSVPIVQVSLGGKGLSQTELYDLGQNFIRGQLATINGAAVPLPYGGEQRSIMVDVEPIQLLANHLTASDLSLALNNQNLVTPSGTEKMGDREYLVGTNSSPGTIAALNELPIRASNGAIVQMKDVAWVHNGYQLQTSYVSENGQASALLTVIKNGASSTLTIVDQVRAAIPKIKAGLPSALTLTPLFDQSVLVRASIQDVVQEAITAAFLTAMMVLVFLGSWRSTLIVSASIPLAILFAIAVSTALGETINIMSLGGLALAVGMLVDDATVEIENTHRNLGVGERKPLATAILDSAEQVAMSALISTMSICIVFVPVTLLSGSAKFIFTPLALSVVLAMVASYGLSRTLVPTMMHFLLPKEVPLYQGQEKESPLSRSFIWRFHQRFEHGFEKFAGTYKGALEWTLEHRVVTLILFAVISLGSLALIPSLGRDFFPYVDSGQMEFHVRPPVGTRIETAIQVFKQVNDEIRRMIPADQLQLVVNNIGLPPGGVNLAYSASDTTSNGDGDVLVLLAEKHRPTQQWMQILRQDFAQKFPQETVFFEPADITNQTLNFGLPAPIDVQVRGKNAVATAEIAQRLQEQIKNVPGAVDVFLQQDGLKESMHGRGSGAVREFALFGETTGETDEFGLPVRYNWAADYRGKALVVYGHTPVPEPLFLNNTVNIDTGSVFGGQLTALRYPEREIVSVKAHQTYYEPARSFLPEATETQRPLQHAQDDVLDLADVVGKRLIDTRLKPKITIREENAIAALEVMSRFASDPKWLIYLPPTMSPTETSKHENLLEHPDEAFDFYRKEGIATVVCEQKHMGSRAVVVLCKDEAVSQKRFGVVQASLGTVYTRTGRRFFTDEALEHQFLARLQSAVERSGLWDELATDWLCLDCELMPWSAKAQELLQKQYAPVGNAGVHALQAESDLITKALLRVPGMESLSTQTTERLSAVEHYTQAYRQYCWPVGSLADLKLAPFHILASEGAVHTDKPHTWHMETIAKLCDADTEILFATPFKIVDLQDEASTADAVTWWTEMTAQGREGMVVKPLNFIAEGRRGITQPAIKCRGAEYLRIIYGPEYLLPENLERLRSRNVGAKRSLASREFALGIEALERFARKEPLRLTHECVFGVLALESEPIDPRL